MIHQPAMLRLVAWVARGQPWFGRMIKSAATRADVVSTFERQTAFSSSSHRPNLIAGDFVIGMESGARHSAERRLVDAQFPPATDFGLHAAQEARKRSDELLGGDAREFDLIDDYMVPLAWQAISGAFGARLPQLPPGDPMLMNLRYLGAHLIVGPVATERVQERARDSAAAVNAWVRSNIEPLRQAWTHGGFSPEREEVARNVVGMLWVGHPATAQSGALVMQELLARWRDPRVAGFVDRVRRHADPWADAELREEAKGHVLEALRLRPPFPILTRDVRRDTLTGAGGAGRVRGGTRYTVMGIGAMSDPAAMREPQVYRPGRKFRHEEDRYLMFGWGARQCPGRDPVVEILASALLGIVRLPHLQWASPWWRRVQFDGPIISGMRLRFSPGKTGR
ncbi:MAG: cytochrome P450 [Proteobacteria bacterium]|nr:cytochrome P450 [Pseudomonadota bacterium]